MHHYHEARLRREEQAAGQPQGAGGVRGGAEEAFERKGVRVQGELRQLLGSHPPLKLQGIIQIFFGSAARPWRFFLNVLPLLRPHSAPSPLAGTVPHLTWCLTAP